MKLRELFKREYRLLVLAVIFFIVGAIFFWRDAALPQTSAPQPVATVQPTAQSVSGARGTGALDPDFANLPPPSQFRTIAYGANGINGSPTLTVSSTCNAAYVAILLFPSSVDYRGDIDAAVYNRALPCTAGKLFTTSIATSDMATAPFGDYYVIVADEGGTRTWYNPR